MTQFVHPIDSFLGVDPTSDLAQLVTGQINHDDAVLERLIEIREEKFPDLEEFAKKIGVRLEYLEEFEADPIDANLDLVRNYCAGLMVSIKHEIHQSGSGEFYRSLHQKNLDAIGTYQETITGNPLKHVISRFNQLRTETMFEMAVRAPK